MDEAGGGIERVFVGLHPVVLMKLLHQLMSYERVGIREDIADIVDGIVDPVASDAVVGGQTLTHIVEHLLVHLFCRWTTDGGDKQDGDQETEKDDEPAQTTMVEHLSYGLFLLISSSVCLIHNGEFLGYTFLPSPWMRFMNS